MGSGSSKPPKVVAGPGHSRVGPDARLKPPSPVDGLSDAQLEEFHEAFNMYDKDGGGSIDKGELKDLLASVGQMPSDAELQYMIDAVDADNTGDIDFCAFAAMMRVHVLRWSIGLQPWPWLWLGPRLPPLHLRHLGQLRRRCPRTRPLAHSGLDGAQDAGRGERGSDARGLQGI